MTKWGAIFLVVTGCGPAVDALDTSYEPVGVDAGQPSYQTPLDAGAPEAAPEAVDAGCPSQANCDNPRGSDQWLCIGQQPSAALPDGYFCELIEQEWCASVWVCVATTDAGDDHD